MAERGHIQRPHHVASDPRGTPAAAKRRSVPPPSADGLRPQALHSAPTVSIWAQMIDAVEKRLIEALKSVDAHGDAAPAHVHDPMTMLLRENGKTPSKLT